MLRTFLGAVGALVVVGAVLSCSSILGLDEFQDESAGPSGGSGPGGGGPSSGTGGAGGMAEPGKFLLEAPSKATVPVSGTATVVVTVKPGVGFDGEVTVSASGLPAGVSADPLSIPSGMSSGDLVLHATAAAKVEDTATATLTGTSGSIMATANVDVTIVGKPGTVDTTFGNNGVAIDNLGAGFSPLAGRVLPDGSITIVGTVAANAVAAHYLATGAVDSSYGDAGKATVTPGPAPEWQGVTIEDDGSVLLATRTFLSGEYTRYYHRLTPAGELDGAFGMNGAYTVGMSFSAGAKLGPVRAYPDGSFLSYASGLTAGGVGRRLVNGDADPSFTGMNSLPSGITGLVLALDESKNVLVGCDDMRVVRLTSTGDEDITFGTYDGGLLQSYAQADFLDGAAGTQTPSAFVSHQNATYVVGTIAPDMGSYSAALGIAAFDAQGKAVSTFGTDGKTDLLQAADGAFATTGDDLMLEGEASLIACGSSHVGAAAALYLAKYGLDGVLDMAFGTMGIASVSLEPDARCVAVGHQPNGRLLMVGTANYKARIVSVWP